MRAPSPTPRPSRRPLRTSSAAAVGVLALLAAAGCGSDDGPVTATATVARGDVAEVVDAPGTVQPRASSVVRAPATGTVATLLVTDGQQVAAGDVLMTIDSPSAAANLQQAQAADAEAASSASSGSAAKSPSQVAAQQRRAAADAQARFTDAEQQAQAIPDPAARAAALAAVQSSRTQYQLLSSQTQALVDQVNSGLGNLDSAVQSLGQAQRVQTRAAVAAAQATVEALTVTAPISGKVSLAATGGAGSTALPAGAEQLLAGSGVQVPAGALSGGGGSGAAGAPVLAQGRRGGRGLDGAERHRRLHAEPDRRRRRDRRAHRAARGPRRHRHRRGGRGALPRHGDQRGPHRPERRRRRGDVHGAPELRRRDRRATGTRPPTPLPGMSASVSLVVRSVSDVVEVPASAVVRAGAQNGSPDADTVWVVSGGRAQRREVVVGVRGDADVEITHGLSPGEEIVTQGAGDVTRGQRIP